VGTAVAGETAKARVLADRWHVGFTDISGGRGCFAKLWNTLLALAGTHPDRSVISHRLYRFYTWCADAGVPEVERLAATVQTDA
jgi:hypothetical protein